MIIISAVYMYTYGWCGQGVMSKVCEREWCGQEAVETCLGDTVVFQEILLLVSALGHHFRALVEAGW